MARVIVVRLHVARMNIATRLPPLAAISLILHVSETGIIIPNMNTCLCGTEMCEAETYCNPDAATKCHKQYCADYPDIDLLCQRTVLEGQTQTLYSNGVKNGNPQCAGTTCLPTDFDTCCKECEGLNVGVSNGKCSKKCNIVCDGDYITPPTELLHSTVIQTPYTLDFVTALSALPTIRTLAVSKLQVV